MDALYFWVSTDRQTTENQFEDLLQVAEKDGSPRDWGPIRGRLFRCVEEEQLQNGRVAYRVRSEVVTELSAGLCLCRATEVLQDRREKATVI